MAQNYGSPEYIAQLNEQDTIEEKDDPRHVEDLYRENMQLKEQMIEQIMTLEQYKNVAYVWLNEMQKQGLTKKLGSLNGRSIATQTDPVEDEQDEVGLYSKPNLPAGKVFVS